MSAEMTSLSRGGWSLQVWARIAGVLILLSILGGGFGEAFAPAQIIVSGDAAATAHHVVASNALFRVGFAAYTLEGLCDVALSAAFFVLIRQINIGLAVVFLMTHLMATAVFAFAEVFYFAPAFILSGDSYLKSFTTDQLNTLALLSLNVYGFAGGFSELFYGMGSVLLGYMVFRSEILPRLLGILWVISGVAFAAETYVIVLAPGYDSPIYALPTILTLVLTAGWLLAKGVDSRWAEALSGTGAHAAAAG